MRCDEGQEAQELGTALGHLLLYIQLVANIVGSPLLHQVCMRPPSLESARARPVRSQRRERHVRREIKRGRAAQWRIS